MGLCLQEFSCFIYELLDFLLVYGTACGVVVKSVYCCLHQRNQFIRNPHVLPPVGLMYKSNSRFGTKLPYQLFLRFNGLTERGDFVSKFKVFGLTFGNGSVSLDQSRKLLILSADFFPECFDCFIRACRCVGCYIRFNISCNNRIIVYLYYFKSNPDDRWHSIFWRQ